MKINEDVANEILIGMLGIVLHAIKIVAVILAGIFFLVLALAVITGIMVLVMTINESNKLKYDEKGRIINCDDCPINDCTKYTCKFHPENRMYDEKEKKEVLKKKERKKKNEI